MGVSNMKPSNVQDKGRDDSTLRGELIKGCQMTFDNNEQFDNDQCATIQAISTDRTTSGENDIVV
jgi:hypothetical protein